MLKNDYIMRLVEDLVRAILRSIEKKDEEDTPVELADLIEDEVGRIVDMDPSLFFSLEPKSAVSLMSMGEMNSEIAEYIARAIYYEAILLEGESVMAKAKLRRSQADAIAAKYEVYMTEDQKTQKALEEFFMEQEESKTDEGSQ